MGRHGPSLPSTTSFFPAIIIVGFVWLLLFHNIPVESTNGGRRASNLGNPVVRRSDQSSEGKVTDTKLVPRPESDVNYMSKRRVPNGPDPIHNRRAGNSKEPPGQA